MRKNIFTTLLILAAWLAPVEWMLPVLVFFGAVGYVVFQAITSKDPNYRPPFEWGGGE